MDKFSRGECCKTKSAHHLPRPHTGLCSVGQPPQSIIIPACVPCRQRTIAGFHHHCYPDGVGRHSEGHLRLIRLIHNCMEERFAPPVLNQGKGDGRRNGSHGRGVNCTGHQSRFACSPLQRRAQTPDGWHLCACLFAFASMVVRAMCVFECVCGCVWVRVCGCVCVCVCTRNTIRVGQNHTFIGIYGVYTVFLAEKSPEGVIWANVQTCSFLH